MVLYFAYPQTETLAKDLMGNLASRLFRIAGQRINYTNIELGAGEEI
jgi:hypothetical protein